MTTIRTVTVGPFRVFFSNVNRPMGLRHHAHTADVTVVFDTLARHGYPAFADTNNALRRRLRHLTDRPFRDATNEDVVDRLFEALDGWVPPEWKPWGGGYQLRAVHLDVMGVLDDIGHDDSTTRYSVERLGFDTPAAPAGAPQVLPAGPTPPPARDAAAQAELDEEIQP